MLISILIQTNESANKDLFSSKDVRNLIQQLRTLSTNDNTNPEHKKFVRAYEKTVRIKYENRQLMIDVCVSG